MGPGDGESRDARRVSSFWLCDITGVREPIAVRIDDFKSNTRDELHEAIENK